MTIPAPAYPAVSEPVCSPVVERLWARLPQVYRVYDARTDWTFKRWLSGILTNETDLDKIVDEVWGARPVGPDDPVPWGMSPAELDSWRRARQTRDSALGDPFSARPEWLGWLAQCLGIRLDARASDAERRDTIRYATSGWEAGTRLSIANAARSALTGTKFSRVFDHWRPNAYGQNENPTMWDITVVTRTSETPDPEAVLRTIYIKGAKPAGAILHHLSYEAPWDTIESLRPTWDDWELTHGGVTTWMQLEETGLTFDDVPGQLFTDASYEKAGTDAWVTTGGSQEKRIGGVDGFRCMRLTALGATVEHTQAARFETLPEQDYRAALNIGLAQRTGVALVGRFSDQTGASLGEQVIDYGTLDPAVDPETQQSPTDLVWFRIRPPARWTTPTRGERMNIALRLYGLTSGAIVDVDAWEVRRYTGGAT